MTSRRLPALLAGALALAACSGTLPDPAIVNTPRILAVRASPPEAQPGQTVTLDALVAFAPADAVYTWSLCNVNLVLGAASCTEPQYLTTLGTGASLTMTVPADTLQQIPPALQKSGISLYVALDIRSPSGARGLSHPVAVRSITVSTNPDPNTNPVISWVLVDGSEHPTLLPAPSDVTLEGKAAPGSAQIYVDVSTGVTVTETLRFHWFVSDGTIDSDNTEPNLVTGQASTIWEYAGTAPPQEWVVLIDSRGGVDWWVP